MGFMDGLDQDYAPGWKPEPGDAVQGIVEGISHRDGEYGEYPIITLRRISGPEGAETVTPERVAIHCMSTVLKDWANEMDPPPFRGDRVAVRFNGRKISEKSGRSYDDFSKIIQRADEVPANLRIGNPPPAPAPSGFMGQLDQAGNGVQPAPAPAPATAGAPEPW